MHRAFNAVNLLPGVHPGSKSAHGPKDACRKGVTAALYGELAHYITGSPFRMTGLRKGQRKNVAVGTSSRKRSGVDHSKMQKGEDSILPSSCARACVCAHT